jgi:hypothetical protein
MSEGLNGNTEQGRAEAPVTTGSYAQIVVGGSTIMPGMQGEESLDRKSRHIEALIAMLGSKGYYVKEVKEGTTDPDEKNLWKYAKELATDVKLPPVHPAGSGDKLAIDLKSATWSCMANNQGAIDKMLKEAVDQAYRQRARELSLVLATLENLCFQEEILEPNVKMSRASIHSSAVKAYDDTRAMFETDDDEDAANDEAPTDAEASDGQ